MVLPEVVYLVGGQGDDIYVTLSSGGADAVRYEVSRDTDKEKLLREFAVWMYPDMSDTTIKRKVKEFIKR